MPWSVLKPFRCRELRGGGGGGNGLPAHTERARAELDTTFSEIIFLLFDHLPSFLFWFVQS